MTKQTNLTTLLLTLAICLMVWRHTDAQGVVARFQMRPIATSNSERTTDFVYSVAAGAVFEDAIELTNLGDTDVTLSIYHAGATTAENGGVTILDANASATAVSRWVTMAPLELTLAPEESRTLPFQVHVPANTPAGEYMTGIAAEVVSDETTAQAGLAIKFVQRAAVPMLLKVAGDTSADLQINALSVDSSNGMQRVSAELENIGNVGFKPQGELLIHGSDGALIHQQDVQLGYVIAADTALMQVALSAEIPQDNYKLTLDLNVGDKHAHKVIEQAIEEVVVIPTLAVETEVVEVAAVQSQPVAEVAVIGQAYQAKEIAGPESAENNNRSLWIGLTISLLLLLIALGLSLILISRQRQKNKQRSKIFTSP